MKASEAVVRIAVSKGGAALDRYAVRITRHSFVSWIFAWAAGVEYNAPLLLTAIGAVTGKKRTVVLPYFTLGQTLCVVGSRGGAATDPYWARNLRKHPQAWIRMNGKRHSVQARIPVGEEREVLWSAITERAPVYLEYQHRARNHREIPVIVLSDL